MKPYGILRILWKWLGFKRRAKGIQAAHSPFLYDLYRNCLQQPYPKHRDLEQLRRSLTRDGTILSYVDHGREQEEVHRKVKEVASRSLKPRQLAELIAALASYFKVQHALELGTSLGITTAYMARSTQGKVVSMEGGEAVSAYAQVQWNKLNISSIEPMIGPFDQLIDQLDPSLQFDLIFVDGHHQYAPTLSYFKRLMRHAHPNTLFIFDDIHWSKDMEKAWKEIQQTDRVTLCLDLFWIGLVFLRPQLSRQTMELRY